MKVKAEMAAEVYEDLKKLETKVDASSGQADLNKFDRMITIQDIKVRALANMPSVKE